MLLNPYRFGSAPSPITAGLWGAYSINKVISAYGGSALRVRRSSDNAEQDIGFSGSALDTTSLASFVGSDSAYVTIMYDQSGVGGNLIQATTSKQPRIVNAGVYDGFVRFDGAAHGFQSANNSGTPSGVTLFISGQLRSSGSGIQMLGELSADGVINAGLMQYFNVSNTNTQLYSGPNASRVGINYTQNLRTAGVHAVRLDRTAGTKSAQLNLYIGGTVQSGAGSDNGSATTGNLAANKWNIGARNNAASLWSPLNMTSCLIYETAKSSGDIATISALI
jgi:hypothetical protein